MPEIQQTKIILSVIKYVLLIGTITVLAAACASTRWVVIHWVFMLTSGSTTIEVEIGLWKICVQGLCSNIPEELVGQRFPAGRGLLISAVSLSTLSAVVSLIGEFLKGRKGVGQAMVILGFLTVNLAIATGFIFRSYANHIQTLVSTSSTKHSVGYALVWISVPLAIGAAVVSYFDFEYKLRHYEGGQPGMNNLSLIANAVPMATTAQHPYSDFRQGVYGVAQPMTPSSQTMTSIGQSQLVMLDGQQMMMQAPPGCKLVDQSPASGSELQWVAVPISTPGPNAASSAPAPMVDAPAPADAQIA